MIIKRRRSLLSLFFILLLAACSPHPGSGIWLSVDDTGPYGKLAILFEGQAELYPVGRKAYRYRCFWAYGLRLGGRSSPEGPLRVPGAGGWQR